MAFFNRLLIVELASGVGGKMPFLPLDAAKMRVKLLAIDIESQLDIVFRHSFP
jgi:hypothetical protein